MALCRTIKELELKTGVDLDEFENFTLTEFLPKYDEMGGIKSSLYICNRGKRVGKYLMITDFESLERRDELFVGDGKGSDEFKQWYENNKALADKFCEYVVYEDSPPSTHYTELEL